MNSNQDAQKQRVELKINGEKLVKSAFEAIRGTPGDGATSLLKKPTESSDTSKE